MVKLSLVALTTVLLGPSSDIKGLDQTQLWVIPPQDAAPPPEPETVQCYSCGARPYRYGYTGPRYRYYDFMRPNGGDYNPSQGYFGEYRSRRGWNYGEGRDSPDYRRRY